jgi:hypothetical protein
MLRWTRKFEGGCRGLAVKQRADISDGNGDERRYDAECGYQSQHDGEREPPLSWLAGNVESRSCCSSGASPVPCDVVLAAARKL